MNTKRNWALLAPTLALDALLFVIPLVLFFRYGLSAYVPGQMFGEGWTFSTLGMVFTSDYYLSIMRRTFATAIVATILTTIIAVPASLMIRRTRPHIRQLLISLLVFPFMVGGVIRSLGWVALLSENGLLNRTLMQLGIIEGPLKILNTNASVVLGIVSIELPLLIIIVNASLESVGRDVEEASENLGASEWETIIHVTLPIALPGIGTGAVLVFIQATNTYISSRLLGGPTLPMMAPAIYDELTANMNWPVGSALSLLLVLITIAVTALSSRAFTPKYLNRSVA